MHVPETAVNKDYFPSDAKHKIGLAGKVGM
jgi:hypothetical protein